MPGKKQTLFPGMPIIISHLPEMKRDGSFYFPPLFFLSRASCPSNMLSFAILSLCHIYIAVLDESIKYYIKQVFYYNSYHPAILRIVYGAGLCLNAVAAGNEKLRKTVS